MAEEIGEVSWTPLLESHLRKTGEKAHALSWMHMHASRLYSRRTMFIDLPVIIGSGTVAFLSAGSSTLFEGETKLSSISLGVGSLILAIMQSVNSYFGWARRSEGHKIGNLQFARLFRFISIQMGLPREERMAPAALLKHVSESYDRLAETCPVCPPETIAEFKKRFGGSAYADVARPPEVNGLERVLVFAEGKDSERQERCMSERASQASEKLGNVVLNLDKESGDSASNASEAGFIVHD
jgi:hypothetical protein